MFRYGFLKVLYRLPSFRGQGRLVSLISKSFEANPMQLSDGLFLELDASEWGQLEIIAKGATEPFTLKLMRELIKEGDIIVDVGAHIGHHAMVSALACGMSGRVIAIDPQPYNVDRIARNANHNGLSNVEAVCAAVGAEDKFIKIHLQDSKDRSRLSLADSSPNDQVCLIDVPMRRLDTLFESKKVSNVKLLKIDVEGYEFEVLLGIGSKIADIENIILEVLDSTCTILTRKILEFLTGSGFLLYDIEGRKWEVGQPLPECNLWATRKHYCSSPSQIFPGGI